MNFDIRHAIAASLCVTALLGSPLAAACDTDAECGPGGTCIKREKRARGVCYGGGRLEEPASTSKSIDKPAIDNPTSNQPRAVEGELRERAEAWLGDPDQLRGEHLPGRETGGLCVVTQDCPDGFECVVAGFEGRCVRY